jgi:RNA polymerase sigma-70 factor (ECF subfamily)
VHLSRKDAADQMPDGELVRLLVAGDHDAMAVIFDRYYRLVMSVALRIIHDVEEAEDVVQTVFTDFYQKAEIFDETKGNLKTWLLQYTYGRSFNQKRKLKNRCFYEQVELDEMDIGQSTKRSERVADLDSQDATRLVEQILPLLTEKQRSVIELVFFDGFKLSEVASRTGESPGNVHHAYYRGIEKLRGFLIEAEEHHSNDANMPKERLSWLRTPGKAPQRLTGEVDIA